MARKTKNQLLIERAIVGIAVAFVWGMARQAASDEGARFARRIGL